MQDKTKLKWLIITLALGILIYAIFLAKALDITTYKSIIHTEDGTAIIIDRKERIDEHGNTEYFIQLKYFSDTGRNVALYVESKEYYDNKTTSIVPVVYTEYKNYLSSSITTSLVLKE